MGPISRSLRLVLPLAACLVLAAPVAHAGADDFEFGRKLAAGRHFKLARKVYEQMLAAPNASERTKSEALFGMATLGYEEASAARARPETTFAETVRLFHEAAEQINAFAKKNPGHPRALEANLLPGQIRLEIVIWSRDLLDKPEDMAARKTNAAEVSEEARRAVDLAVKHFDGLKSAPKPLGDLATYYGTTAQYYRALTLDAGSAGQIEALKLAEKSLEDYITDHDGEMLAVFAADSLGLALAERAKHASANQEEQIQLYQKAFQWFQACIDQPYEPSDESIVVITNGYQHYGKACLEAGRIGTRNFLREGVDVLSQMLERVPRAGKHAGGIRALLVLGDLHLALGNSGEAVQIYTDASERAAQIEQPRLENEANKRVNEATRGNQAGITNIGVLRKSAEASFNEKRWEEAIAAFQRVIALAPATPQAFMEHVWPAWERIAAAYRELGDPLSAAMAHDAVHEAWLSGQVPHKKGDENDANMRRAGNNRRKQIALFDELYARTRSKVYQEAMKQADLAFATDYPDHPDSKSGPTKVALEKLKAAREAKRTRSAGWRSLFDEAAKLFEQVGRDLKSDNQDPAAASAVSSRLQMIYDPGASEPSPEGLKAAEAALVLADAYVAFAASTEGQQKLKDFPALLAKRTDALQNVRLWRLEALKALKRWDVVIADGTKLWEELGASAKGFDALALVVEAMIEKGDVEAADKAIQPLLKDGKHPALPALVGKLAGTFDNKFRELTKVYNALQVEINGTSEDRSTGLAPRDRATTSRYNDLLQQRVTKEAEAAEHRRQIDAWRKDPALVKGMTQKVVDDLEQNVLPRLDAEIAKITPELTTLQKTSVELKAKLAAAEAKVAEVLVAQYQPLKEAVRRFDVGLQSQMDAGTPVRPGEVSNIAARWYAAARNASGTDEDWKKARERYEQYVAMPEVKALPDTDKEKRSALAKLGRIYARASELEKDPAKRAAAVRQAILLLETTLAARPENNELVLGLLNGRYGTVVWENPLERGTLWRFIVPKTENAAALKAAIAKLGAQDAPVPLPRQADDTRRALYLRALTAWKEAMSRLDGAELELLYKDVRGSGLDLATYRELGNVDREFREALASAYAESGEDADLAKGETMLATLLNGPIAAEEYSPEWWDSRTLAIRMWVLHSERLAAAGGVPARASALRKKASQWITSTASVTAVPEKTDIGRPREDWLRLIERLNRGLRAEGAPEVSVRLDLPMRDGTTEAAPGPGPAPAPEKPAPEKPAPGQPK